MKRILLYILCLTTVYTKAQVINIPDPNFKALLLQTTTTNLIAGGVKVDANDDGEIEQSEALAVYTFDFPPGNITDLTGIEYFTNLVDIACPSNHIASADLSALTHLETLGLGGNQLTSLNLTGLTHLYFIQCGGNQLSQIDFSTLTVLKIVQCNYNLFTVLDFSNNPLFDQLACTFCPNLTTIKIKNNRQQIFTQTLYNSCWDNNPNLSTICVDDFEVSGLQTFLANCGITQPITIVTDCALSNETFTLTDFSIAPNPTKGSMFFDNSKANFTTASVYNYLGQEIMVQKLEPSSKEEINLVKFPQGAYVLNVTNGVQSIHKTILKN